MNSVSPLQVRSAREAEAGVGVLRPPELVDIVGCTQIARRLGGTAWREIALQDAGDVVAGEARQPLPSEELHLVPHPIVPLKA